MCHDKRKSLSETWVNALLSFLFGEKFLNARLLPLSFIPMAHSHGKSLYHLANLMSKYTYIHIISSLHSRNAMTQLLFYCQYSSQCYSFTPYLILKNISFVIYFLWTKCIVYLFSILLKLPSRKKFTFQTVIEFLAYHLYPTFKDRHPNKLDRLRLIYFLRDLSHLLFSFNPQLNNIFLDTNILFVF